MRIKALDIYGYGKWVEQRFDLNDQLQIFYGHNEAGKSTLQSFIRSILFGFPHRRRRNNQFKPKQTTTYGGRLLVEDDHYGQVWIERVNNQLNLTTYDGETLDSSVLDDLLGGLDEELFDTFYSFTLQNLQSLATVGAQELNDFFLSIGTVGSDKFLQAAKQLEHSSDQLYRPQATTRPVNVELIELEQQAKQLQTAQQSMEQYDQLIIERTEAQDELKDLRVKQKELEQKSLQQERLMERYDLYLKQQGLQKELSRLTYTPFPEKAQERYEDAKRQQVTLQTKMTELETKIQHLKEEVSDLTRLNWALNHQADRKSWLQETNHIKEVQTQIEQHDQRIDEQRATRYQLAEQGKFDPEKVEPTAEYQQKVEAGLALQSQLAELQTEYDQVLVECNMLEEQRRIQQTYSSQARQQVAKLETQRMNEEAQLVEQTSLRHYLYGFIPSVVGIGWLLSNRLQDPPVTGVSFWFSLFLLIVGVIILGVTFYSHRQRYANFQASPIMDKIHELRSEEQRYIDQSQTYSQSWNERQQQLQQLNEEIKAVKADQSQWLTSIGFALDADPNYILKYEPVNDYFQALTHEEKLQKAQQALIDEVNEWQELLQPLFERFPPADDHIRSLIRHVEETEATLNTSVMRGEALNQRIKDARQSFSKSQEDFNQQTKIKHQLLDESNSQDEFEFQQKLAENQQIDQLKQKIQLYDDQLRNHLDQLESIESKQILANDIRELKQQIDRMSDQIQPLHHKLANLAVEINRLEQDGNYAQLQQTFANQQAKVTDLIVKWGQERVAMELIYQTLRQGIENPLPAMKELATQLFERLSYGRYNDIRFNQTGIKVRQFSDVLFEPHELSQGTLEQLYVALRLAFIQTAKNMVQLPIIIDDAFVNFDEMRKASMYQVLEDLSQEHQILFFTFDSQAKGTFERESIIDLDALATKEELD